MKLLLGRRTFKKASFRVATCVAFGLYEFLGLCFQIKSIQVNSSQIKSNQFQSQDQDNVQVYWRVILPKFKSNKTIPMTSQIKFNSSSIQVLVVQWVSKQVQMTSSISIQIIQV